MKTPFLKISTYLLLTFLCVMQVHSQTIYPVDLFDNATLYTGLHKRSKCFAFDSIGNRLFQAGHLLKIVNPINYSAISYTFPAITLGGTNTNISIEAIAYSNDVLYIGGLFDNVCGQAKNGLAAIQISNGTVLSWNPSPEGTVTNLLVDGSYLYVTFNAAVPSYSLGVRRYNISGLSPDSTWSPNLATLPGSFSPASALAGTDKLIAYGANLYRLFEGDIYKLNKTNNTIIPLYNAVAGQINDFTIQNGKAYIAGNFTFFYNLSNVPINRNNAACVALSTGTFTPWNPDFSEPQQCIAAYGDTILVGNNTFNPATVNGSTSLSYYLNHVNSTTGTFVNGVTASGVTSSFGNLGYLNFYSYGDRILAFEHEPPSSGNQLKHYYPGDPYCLHPRKRMSFLTTSTNICQGTNNVIYKANIVNEAATYNWWYSGTGVTITGNGTATVSLNFGGNAISGNLSVQGSSGCGYTIPSASYFVNVYPTNITVSLPITNISCFNKKVAILSNSSTSNVSYSWFGPLAFTSSNKDDSTGFPGKYVATVTNTLTGCLKKDSVFVGIDTLRPVVTLPASAVNLYCLPDSSLLNGTSSSPSPNIWWHIANSGVKHSNPYYTKNIGNYYMVVQNMINGCKDSTTFTVGDKRVLPNHNITSHTYSTALIPLETITCINTNATIVAASDTANTTITWKSISNNVVYSNPLSINTQGYFKLIIKRADNGCTDSSLIAYIAQNITPPNISITTPNASINCSNSTATLNANTSFITTNLNWNGPSGFTSSNPAVTNTQGKYYITATSSDNGCTKKDSLNVNYSPTLVVHTNNDTMVCKSSLVNLQANITGTLTGINYIWSNSGSGQSININPAMTTQYIVTANSTSGCSGKDTVIVIVPADIQDSIITAKSCNGAAVGSISIYTKGGISPYLYSFNGGAFTTQTTYTNLPYATYPIVIKDALGCTKNTSASINQNSSLPIPVFIASTQNIKGDTIVLIDLTVPKADSVQWQLPGSASVVGGDMFNPLVYFADTGNYVITLTAFYADCSISGTKNIHVAPIDTTIASANNNNGIKSITLYPNPNTGVFTADIEFYKKQNASVLVWDALAIKYFQQNFLNVDFISLPVDVSNLSNGTYIFKVIGEYNVKHLNFVISK